MTQATKRGMVRVSFELLENLLELPQGVRVVNVTRTPYYGDEYRHCFTVHVMAPASDAYPGVPYSGEGEDSMYLTLDKLKRGEWS